MPESIETLKNCRSTTKGCITRIRRLVEQKHDTLSLPELECRLGILESYFKQLLSVQDSIEKALPEDSTHESVRTEIEDLYVSTKAIIMSLLAERRPSAYETSHASFGFPTSAPSNLPKIKLPTFSGEYTEYTSFISTFRVLVDDNSRLSPIEKFRHLQSCLSGRAKSAIGDLEITAANYAKALSCLDDRFNVKTLIFESHVSKIFELPKTVKNSAADLRNLLDEINTNLDALKSMGSVEEILDAILIHLATERLDPNTTSKWEESRALDSLPSWSEFSKVLNRRCQFLEVKSRKQVAESTSSRTSIQGKPPRPGNHRSMALTVTDNRCQQDCVFCSAPGHNIHKCPDFLSLSINDRFNKVKDHALCINCLWKGHSLKQCKSSHCRVCSKPHNTLLHRYNNSAQSVQSSSNLTTGAQVQPCVDEVQTTSQAVISSLHSAPNEHKPATVVLATAIIEVADQLGQFHTTRALLDSASQVNFITDSLAQKLRLTKSRLNAEVSGIGKRNTKVKFNTCTTIKSRFNDFQRNLDLWLLPSITNVQPNNEINIKNWNIPSLVQLADPNFNRPQGIELLIGAEIFFELLTSGHIKLGPDLPSLHNSQLGWLVSGSCKVSQDYNPLCCISTSPTSPADQSLETLVERFWLVEDVSPRLQKWNAEQTNCEDFFLNTVRREPNGRFCVRLPFKDSANTLGNSFETAEKRFLALERTLSRNSILQGLYSDFLTEYEQLKHMELVSPSELPAVRYHLPHHGVHKPDSSSTKLRVVFDGGCRTSTNRSLNDILMVGPTVQDDLFSIVFRFRFHKYALTADIVKMYRQINIDKSDSYFQCILWRNHPSEQLKTYRLTTVTYGTAPAPYLATRCLNFLADEYADIYPSSSSIIKHDFYVDNLISGADSLEEIIRIKTEINVILQSAQFELKKWYSNSQQFVDQIAEGDREVTLRINDSDVIKTLGLMWDPILDQFRYVAPPQSKCGQITKRVVLADLSKLFDPLGFVNPVVSKGKVFLQNLWKENLDWDSVLPLELQKEWKFFRKQLEALPQIRIPRFVLSQHGSSTIELHGFGDASKRCYGCCIYLRVIDVSGNISVRLLCAKSKVAPIRVSRTIPELELCASHLLSTLLHRILPMLPQFAKRIILWTDSSIVLSWLRTSPSSLAVFVANRVSRIQELTEGCSWRHVDSMFNPADIVSRGAGPEELINSFWFSGPPYLHHPESSWPAPRFTDPDKCDERTGSAATLITTKLDTPDCISTCKYINDFRKLRHVFAYVQRFLHNLKAQVKKQPRSSGQLSTQELEASETIMAFVMQQQEFATEISALMANADNCPNGSSIKKLNPFLCGTLNRILLRVGGRLQNADLPFDCKHPILLPKNHPFLTSYVTYLHFKHYHAGAQALTSMVRQKYWASNLKRITTAVVRRCMHCFRYQPKLMQQIMGDLPASRVQPDRPFNKTGVDFCGPIWTRSSLHSKQKLKSYVAVFVCFVTKAIHLESVSDLSTKAFLAALTRFTSRRGLPRIIFCDNATNFVGARNELRELRKFFLDQTTVDVIHRACAEDHIQFCHIPPRAPHFGGLWEAAVRSMKKQFLKTCGSFTLTFEEFATVLTQVEAILNSRPITPLSEDPSDEEALTPGHFLIGAPLLAPLSPDVSTQNIAYLNRWTRLRALTQHFWRRWSREYLLDLQKRTKWQTPTDNATKDMLVLVHDDNLPPQKWLLGRLLTPISGQDGRNRVVDIRTKNGVIRRPIHKVAPLPMDT